MVSIIESRARGLDLLTHNYYELLYAFHISRHNYRKGETADTQTCFNICAAAHRVRVAVCVCVYVHSAGTIMFEFGMRLGREVRTLLGLQKQVNCYLAALNCLRLIRPEYAWIVQPAAGSTVVTNNDTHTCNGTHRVVFVITCVSLLQYERPGASPKRNADGEFPPEPGESVSLWSLLVLWVCCESLD